MYVKTYEMSFLVPSKIFEQKEIIFYFILFDEIFKCVK